MFSINNYITKRAITSPWEIYPQIKQKYSHAIIVPCLGELEDLPNLLISIEKNNPVLLKEIIVIIVINNSIKENKSLKNENEKTYEFLENSIFDFNLGIVDAFSKKFALPIKDAGVGLARKIGMDLILPHLKNERSLIFSTDADAIIDNNYFNTIINYFDKNKNKAAVVGFKHSTAKYPLLKEKINEYELFLYQTAKKIKDAGSPYGYVSMGSAMVCTLNAYVSVGGMPKKKATEDFYFLQELTKYCGIHTISKTLVYPSARPQSRVYLGTGHRMKQSQEGFNINNLSYSNDSFLYLQKWLDIGTSSWKINLVELFKKTNEVNEKLTNFIVNEHIQDIWMNLQSSSPSKIHFKHQFHRWFDGLKTIRLLKYFTFLSIF